MSKGHSQKKDSHRRDTIASSTGTSLCTYAIEPPCTERYARWCERSGLFSPSYSIIPGFQEKQRGGYRGRRFRFRWGWISGTRCLRGGRYRPLRFYLLRWNLSAESDLRSASQVLACPYLSLLLRSSRRVTENMQVCKVEFNVI